jgi:hypothetical protein
MPSADVSLQLERGKIELCTENKGTCKVFKVPEHAKKVHSTPEAGE